MVIETGVQGFKKKKKIKECMSIKAAFKWELLSKVLKQHYTLQPFTENDGLDSLTHSGDFGVDLIFSTI